MRIFELPTSKIAVIRFFHRSNYTRVSLTLITYSQRKCFSHTRNHSCLRFCLRVPRLRIAIVFVSRIRMILLNERSERRATIINILDVIGVCVGKRGLMGEFVKKRTIFERTMTPEFFLRQGKSIFIKKLIRTIPRKTKLNDFFLCKNSHPIKAQAFQNAHFACSGPLKLRKESARKKQFCNFRRTKSLKTRARARIPSVGDRKNAWERAPLSLDDDSDGESADRQCHFGVAGKLASARRRRRRPDSGVQFPAPPLTRRFNSRAAKFRSLRRRGRSGERRR